MEDRMSDRQIAATVRFGRKITCYVDMYDHDPITGYVGGMDRYTYFVLVPNPDHDRHDPDTDEPVLRKYLVHKGGTLIELHDESTLDAEPEPFRTELKKIITKFRTKVMDEYFPDVKQHSPRGFNDD
jgi:hypothetical protein